MKRTLVIVGASYAGVQLAACARELGFDGRILLLGDEPDAPYQRPPLSKGFLTGSFAEERLPLRSQAFFDEEKIERMLATRASRIDRERREIELHDGSRIAYDQLALTTGARVRKLDCPGATLDAVHYLRDLRDARRLAASARSARRAVVVGGGYIGLEAASSLRQQGLDVTVVETEPRLLARVASPWVSDFMLRAHVERGVAFELGRKVVALHDACGIVSVELDDGTRVLCDLVVVGIGVIPNTELAANCGLHANGGIIVDACARTSDPLIVAAGDCASFVPHWAPPDTRACRIESVQNANDMARTAASSVLGRSEPYRAVPWFWSDQYDLKLQMAGVNAGFTDFAVRGCADDRKCSLFYFRDKTLIAVDSINRPQDHMLARKLLASGVQVSADEVRNPAFDLKALASRDSHAAQGVA
ncbi:FAD-dependent oxidoreductase [Paraburkholderia phymatum]|uniref:FAD-dependent pyridine nucleotide-disulphide oxidoreductase n=1 Tax=Paraburkholderia phymatum (strain DSM 17167 / CIP 108236 / LMG 21445 / STM815) TaxID=391038 RepID=B2JTT2_PARP8|nr:FAD-dependent oxidoreductase [Paraburkholderia phymatum]ACC75985.1 FAD-dependent pyridine nucleotide-disulphide oxidoreductase [Paraburkholderia phymatum STM815]